MNHGHPNSNNRNISLSYYYYPSRGKYWREEIFLRFHTLVLHLIRRESSSSEYRVRHSTQTAAGDEKSWKVGSWELRLISRLHSL